LKTFVLENKIDEIYCSLNEISNEKLKELVEFADDNNKAIKFIPDTKEIYSKNLKIDYYELFPVLSLQKTQLHNPFVKGIKRAFDVGFSLFVIICILSWLIPLLAILIKIESKGPVFFKQGRPGLDEEEFFCYKFRSMQVNGFTEKEASKKILKDIKDSKLKVTAQMMDDIIRVSAKSINDLQAVIALCRKGDYEIPLQFINMK
jgi:putative colanic acid biosynthesis UDP-glucose lipid carrier transferase